VGVLIWNPVSSAVIPRLACPVKCLPHEMLGIFHWGEACFTGDRGIQYPVPSFPGLTGESSSLPYIVSLKGVNMKGVIIMEQAIKTYLEQAKIGRQQSYKNMALFPLLSTYSLDLDYLMLDEALSAGVIEIDESRPSVGLGMDLRMESKRMTGFALSFDDRIVHLCLFALSKEDGYGRSSSRMERYSRGRQSAIIINSRED
jgi:hypothetical protein